MLKIQILTYSMGLLRHHFGEPFVKKSHSPYRKKHMSNIPKKKREGTSWALSNHGFLGRLSAAPCWRGWGLWLIGLMSVALPARIQACVSAPRLPIECPEHAHLSTHARTSFADLTSLCPGIVLIQQGNCGRKPLMLYPFWRASKKCQIFTYVFHTVLLQTSPRQCSAVVSPGCLGVALAVTTDLVCCLLS